jgi:hypothetical protein
MTDPPKTGIIMAITLDGNIVQKIFQIPNPEGVFEPGQLQYFQSIGRSRPLLFLAFAPKAAGTFFRLAAEIALNAKVRRASLAFGGRDCTPYLPTFLGYYLDPECPPAVIHAHMQAFPANRHFLNAFCIKPIIMIRSLPDLLASFWDMLDTDPVARINGLNCAVPDNFIAMQKNEKAEFVIDIIAPWFVSYFANWKKFYDEAPQTVRVLHYADFCANPSKVLFKAVSHAGFSITKGACEKAIEQALKDKMSLRFNVGKSGRGHTYFSPTQINRLFEMLAHYSNLKPWMEELVGVPDVLRKAS